jgi:hypothetical protein
MVALFGVATLLGAFAFTAQDTSPPKPESVKPTPAEKPALTPKPTPTPKAAAAAKSTPTPRPMPHVKAPAPPDANGDSTTAPATPAAGAPVAAPADAKAGETKAADSPTADSAAPKLHVIDVPTPRPRPPEIPSYRVTLRMKNGRRFGGVVSRDKDFHELVYAGAHHYGDVYLRDERFTLKFVDGLDGDVELAWNQVARLEVREVLDSAGVRAMEEAYKSARVARITAAEQGESTVTNDDPTAAAKDDATKPADGSPAKDATASGDAGKDAKDAKDATKPAKDEKKDDKGDAAKKDDKGDPAKKDEPKKDDVKKLVEEFPPSEGWNPDRKKQIEWRRTVVGVFPEPNETRFLEVYDQWLPGFEQWAAEQAKTAEGDKKAKNEPRGAPKGDRGEHDPAHEKDASKEPSKDAKPAKETSKDPAAPKPSSDAPKDPPKDSSKEPPAPPKEGAPASDPKSGATPHDGERAD